MQKKIAVFTIVSRNYGAFAQTLMQSLKEVHPEWDRHVLLVDRCEDANVFGGELFSTTLIEELPLPDFHSFLFRYDIMEMNTAAKPWMFAKLRSQDYERVVYIDPDILVMNRLVDVENLLDEGAAAVVTPHLTAPITDDFAPSELEIMRAGAYNLGFLALSNLPASDAFIAWWQKKLEFDAISDPSRGLFTDQKWVDLAPGMFGGFAILRDVGYNVAYWNLMHRPISQRNDVWYAENRPLRFFHFSGFNPLNPKPFSKHQNRFSINTIGEAKKLALLYAEKLIQNGHVQSQAHPYAFGVFEGGIKIPVQIRRLFRENTELRAISGSNPFTESEKFIGSQISGLPTILRAVLAHHEHLQKAFPDPLGKNKEALFRWFVSNGATELGIPDEFSQPVRDALVFLESQSGIAQKEHRNVGAISIWARLLIHFHRRATGGVLGAARQMQYQSIKNFSDFLRIGLHQFSRSRLGITLGFGKPSQIKQIELIHENTDATLTTYRRQKSNIEAIKNRVSGVYFEQGKDLFWIGTKAQFLVNQFSKSFLRIKGFHSGDLHLRAHGKKLMRIAVAFDDGPQQYVELTQGSFDLTISLAHVPSTWPAKLQIVPEHSFVPKNIDMGDDERKLSLQISVLEIGGNNVFNAATWFDVKVETVFPLPGVNLIGYARSEHGVGQALRQFCMAIDEVEIPNVVIDFNQNNSSQIDDKSLAHRLVSDTEYGVNIFHINADQMPAAEMYFPSHIFARYNVGYWHWELPKMNEAHLSGFNRLNEIWVPTSFVQDAIAKSSPIPVIKIPHAIKIEISHDLKRANFGLPEGSFIFLMMYDFSSYQERKNPQAALAAFDLARKKYGVDATLVIKTQNAQFHEKDVATLRTSIEGRTDIIWLNKTLSRQEVYDLVACCDSLISLHRSEGFGLGPAEAMFLGKPVIATNWSGNTEFMRPNNSCPVDYRLTEIVSDVGVYQAGQIWAEPDVEHAAWWIGQVVNDAELRKKLSTNAALTMREEFSPQAIGIKISERLRFIQTSLM